MKIFSSAWLVGKATVILYVMITVLFILLYNYWAGVEGSKVTALLGGISTGLFLVIIQFMFSWDEHVERDKLRLLGLKKVLEHKKDKQYYGELISNTRNRIDLMGKTGHHFLEDFANKGGADKEATVLLAALSRGVIVRFLLPETAKNAQNKETMSLINDLSAKYDNFSCQFFEPPECHSIFVADEDVIIGPFFPGVKSMNTPALHVEHDAVLSKCYLEYFNELWKKCEKQR